jgi:DNA-binding transcriptional LysR family regulator
MIAPASTIRKRLRLRHLQLMVALSETESLRRAADELAITQPAATKALKELEDTIGVSLFVRHARGMEPTIFGEAVMRYARVVFEDLDELRDELAAIEAGDIGKVRIGAVMAPAPELLTHAIVALKAAHPRLQISVQIDTSDVLVQALQQDQLDIMLGRIPDGFPALDLSFETLGEEALSIVTRPGHPVARATVRPKIIDQTFRESRVAPPVSTVETSSILTTLSLLLDSDMLAVLPTSVAHYYVELGTMAALGTPLRGRLAPYGLILRKNRRIRPATQLVIDAIRAA